jgi:chemotaxis signal transduction protein
VSVVRASFTPVAMPEDERATTGTAVILDASAAVPVARLPQRAFVAVPAVEVPAETLAPAGPAAYVVFELDGAAYAVAVEQVHEIVRRPRLQPVPGARAAGGDVALVDVRGRSIPVLDGRSQRDDRRPAQVLLPVFRHHVGLVVDRVLGVRTDLAVEQDDVSPVLPARARGVLRPADGGAPVLHVGLPSAADLARDGA